MQTFKLTPKPQSDYRLEIKELKYRCKLETHGYRLDKVVYGFSEKLANLVKMHDAGFNIEEVPFVEAQRDLVKALVERGRAKSKIDHLLHAQEFDGADNADDVNKTKMKLNELNNKIQDAKTALGITGTVKLLKF
ncbi:MULTISPECIES: hypothetical protein [Terasakiella]|uniref:Uncharacterized protein n=1 Tax=Terasakiella brassicae TaxID=1634917 RepID=A0A917FBR2_9PROT|nr:hypothetical protein [Terasakiella brassicae]GGF65822.1 hypothetical protein GCM10011332_19900 [Terasakiella brassicae]